ncbi:competence type IV pilus minor pilin ComGD [Marinilactibacillus piezotolerans]|uniref:competence type IV pilus minor pilin ComGD n=1 Tax=Marinilactibacillus piezotolerans TaxID=258723 RepID=UPI0009AF60F9|nr:competence type IV pilus minor pilin ComGD [Marinilactibacillus piezotolerans]
MRLPVDHSEGFTLIETLLVLALISIMMLLPIIPYDHLKTTMEEDLFFEDVAASITRIQHHAVLNGETTVLTVRPQARDLSFRVIGQLESELNQTIELPEHMDILGGAKVYRFRGFSGNQGNLNIVRFKTKNGFIVLKFKLGSGRFELAEED